MFSFVGYFAYKRAAPAAKPDGGGLQLHGFAKGIRLGKCGPKGGTSIKPPSSSEIAFSNFCHFIASDSTQQPQLRVRGNI